MSVRSIAAGLLLGCLLGVGGVRADDGLILTIRDHKFEPQSLNIPAGKKVKILIRNLDAIEEEFDSYDLDREQVIPGGGTAIVYIGPLKPGTYSFMGELHPLTASGYIVATERK